MDNEILITQAEAAQILGRSVSTVSRCLRDGKLHYADERRRLLLREGLEDRFRAAVRPRVDVPQVKRANREHVPGSANVEHVPHSANVEHAPHLDHQPEPIAEDYWGRLLQKLTYVMDGAPFYWSREPNAHQLMLFTKTLDELRSQLELEGLSPP